MIGKGVSRPLSLGPEPARERGQREDQRERGRGTHRQVPGGRPVRLGRLAQRRGGEPQTDDECERRDRERHRCADVECAEERGRDGEKQATRRACNVPRSRLARVAHRRSRRRSATRGRAAHRPRRGLRSGRRARARRSAGSGRPRPAGRRSGRRHAARSAAPRATRRRRTLVQAGAWRRAGPSGDDGAPGRPPVVRSSNYRNASCYWHNAN